MFKGSREERETRIFIPSLRLSSDNTLLRSNKIFLCIYINSRKFYLTRCKPPFLLSLLLTTLFYAIIFIVKKIKKGQLL